LKTLAEDPALPVRMQAAANAATPPPVLRQLAEERALRPRLAGNPSAPPELLLRLAEGGPPAGRRAVAGNPTCPRGLLEELARDVDRNVAGRAWGRLQEDAKAPPES